MMTGEKVTADNAEKMGMIYKVFKDSPVKLGSTGKKQLYGRIPELDDDRIGRIIAQWDRYKDYWADAKNSDNWVKLFKYHQCVLQNNLQNKFLEVFQKFLDYLFQHKHHLYNFFLHTVTSLYHQ